MVARIFATCNLKHLKPCKRGRNMSKLLAAAAAACLALTATPPARAAGLLLGPFCIEGAALKQLPDQRTFTAGGYWEPIELTYKKPSDAPSKARIDIFDRPIPKMAGLPTCKEA